MEIAVKMADPPNRVVVTAKMANPTNREVVTVKYVNPPNRAVVTVTSPLNRMMGAVIARRSRRRSVCGPGLCRSNGMNGRAMEKSVTGKIAKNG